MKAFLLARPSVLNYYPVSFTGMAADIPKGRGFLLSIKFVPSNTESYTNRILYALLIIHRTEEFSSKISLRGPHILIHMTRTI